jgi:uridine kinase
MPLPVFILITGPACTGKTTLSRWLSVRPGLPLAHEYAHPDVEALIKQTDTKE